MNEHRNNRVLSTPFRVLLIALPFVFFWGCQKNMYHIKNSNIDKLPSTVLDASIWYNNQKLTDEQSKITKVEPDWKNAVVAVVEHITIVKAPIKLDGEHPREAIIMYSDGGYRGYVKEYNRIDDKLKGVKIFSINGRLVKEWVLDKSGHYLVSKSWLNQKQRTVDMQRDNTGRITYDDNNYLNYKLTPLDRMIWDMIYEEETPSSLPD